VNNVLSPPPLISPIAGLEIAMLSPMRTVVRSLSLQIVLLVIPPSRIVLLLDVVLPVPVAPSMTAFPSQPLSHDVVLITVMLLAVLFTVNKLTFPRISRIAHFRGVPPLRKVSRNVGVQAHFINVVTLSFCGQISPIIA
jgi:hypothetical protein